MDMPLTVNLPGDRQSVRCYFIADGRDDPYGQNKISAGPHQKAFHLNPLWFAAQRESDALGMAIYRGKDIPTNTVVLESSFVLPISANSIHFGDRLIYFATNRPAREVVKPGEVLSFRQGAAALALRVPWSRDLHGSPANVELIYDGNHFGAVRLTVEHGKPGPADTNGKPSAGAAFWIRVGTGLSDDSQFKSWLDKFTNSRAEVENQLGHLKVQVEGDTGPVGLDIFPTGETSVNLTPAPARVVLEVNGVDLGSQILGTQ